MAVLADSFTQAVLGASEWLEVGDRVRIQGPPTTVISNSGTGTTRIGVEANVGAVLARGPVDLRDRATVNGIARGSSFAVGNNVTLAGG